jgi:hypothetical protein
MSDGTTCGLCGGTAAVGRIRASDGSILATTWTDCPACGSWMISKLDSALLDKESADTKRHISAKVREQFDADPNHPLVVTEGLMLFCRER